MKRKGYILVVETDDLIRELLGRWPGKAGYTVFPGDYENRASEGVPRLVAANISNPRGARALIRSLQVVYAAPIYNRPIPYEGRIWSHDKLTRRVR